MVVKTVSAKKLFNILSIVIVFRLKLHSSLQAEISVQENVFFQGRADITLELYVIMLPADL